MGKELAISLVQKVLQNIPSCVYALDSEEFVYRLLVGLVHHLSADPPKMGEREYFPDVLVREELVDILNPANRHHKIVFDFLKQINHRLELDSLVDFGSFGVTY